MKLFASRRFFPLPCFLLCFAVLSSHTWANDGEKKEWGYQRDGQSQAKFEEALQLLNNTPGVSLSPHSASDVVLSSFITSQRWEWVQKRQYGTHTHRRNPGSLLVRRHPD